MADLSDLDDVRRLATEIEAAHDRVDVLVHNAGALARSWTASAQGIETTVATQVLGPFLLTTLLRDRLEQAGPGARVLTMASGGMYAERLSVDDLEMGPDDFEGARAYARAKRAQVELTAEWARRGPGLAWPSTPCTPAGRTPPVWWRACPASMRSPGPILRSPEEGADTLVWLAAAPAAALGRQRWLLARPATAGDRQGAVDPHSHRRAGPAVGLVRTTDGPDRTTGDPPPEPASESRWSRPGMIQH